MKLKKVQIGQVFEAQDGSLAKVVTLLPKYRAIVRTYHPKAANDFLYDEEVCLGNLVSGRFSSVNSPNKYGGYIGNGVYKTSHKRVYNAWYKTLEYAFLSGRKVPQDWYDFQRFAAWYVSCTIHLNSDWKMNYSLLLGRDCTVSADSACLLPTEVAKAIRVNKINRITKKIGNSFVISDCVNLELAKNISFVSEEAAISMYCRLKEDRVKTLAEQYKQQLPDHVYQALKYWKCCIDVI